MAELLIRLAAIRSNIDRLRAGCDPACRVMFVCKSDFYGLGLEVAARLEPWVDAFAVGSLAEALLLRARTESREIAVLYPPGTPAALRELLAAHRQDPRIVPTVLPTPEHAACLCSPQAAGTSRAPACYVVVPQVGDRFWTDGPWRETLADLAGSRRVTLRGVFTHIAEAGALGDDELASRVADFAREAGGICPGIPLSVADSHLAGRGLGLSMGFCRVGLFPLGVVEPGAARRWGLKPALRLAARVVNSYALPRPSRVGYGRPVVGQGQAVSVLDVGFASGLPFDFFRHCPALGPEGRAYRFLEMPWMEYSGILTRDGVLAPGAEVELFGDRLDVVAQAHRARLPAEALFCHLSRVSRKIVREDDAESRIPRCKE